MWGMTNADNRKYRITATQKAVILHGVRWARNILVEIGGNYTRALGKESHECLRTAISALTDFDHAMGREHPEEPGEALK